MAPLAAGHAAAATARRVLPPAANAPVRRLCADPACLHPPNWFIQLAELRGALEAATKGMSDMNEFTEEIKFDLDRHRRQFSPSDKISEQPAAAIGAACGGCVVAL